MISTNRSSSRCCCGPVSSKKLVTPGDSRESRRPMDANYWNEQVLPPVANITEAIARQHISQGLSYALPVDKTRNSVENVFRTNLRFVFQEPYLQQSASHFDEAKLRFTSRHHFKMNTVQTSGLNYPNGKQFRSFHKTPPKLNAESDKIMRFYSHTAPPTGVFSRRDSNQTGNKQRSNLFLPLAAKIPPEAQRLKDEAEKILKSVEVKDEEGENDENGQIDIESSGSVDVPQCPVPHPPSISKSKIRSPRATGMTSPQLARNHVTRISVHDDHQVTRQSERRGRQMTRRSFSGDDTSKVRRKRKARDFSSFEELCEMTVPEVREVPEEVKSPYLSDNKNADIWSWLHRGEPQTDMAFFLDVCS